MPCQTLQYILHVLARHYWIGCWLTLSQSLAYAVRCDRGQSHAGQYRWHACAAAEVRLEMAASIASGKRPLHVFNSFCSEMCDWGAACQTQKYTCMATAAHVQT